VNSSSTLCCSSCSKSRYAPPFWGAVKGGVLSVMCSYNLVNGVYACQVRSMLVLVLPLPLLLLLLTWTLPIARTRRRSTSS